MTTASAGAPGLRRTAARGTLINGAYLVFLNSLGFIKGFLAAAVLTVSDYGIWGILSITLIAALWLKEVGVADKKLAPARRRCGLTLSNSNRPS